MSRQYKTGGTTSSIDAGGSRQLNDHFYIKNALIEARKEQYFMPLADTVSMPKHYGKKAVQYVYIPLLDAANVNDQGIDASGAIQNAAGSGNLYGSSKDIGAIPGKLPVLTENGGRVNRIGFVRKVIEGTLQKFGFFSEYTKESVDFDSDSELMTHVNRETINGAHEVTEDVLQIDLINAAGIVRYTGAATQNNQVADVVTYKDIMHLGIDLDNNRTPKHTTIITGTRNIDTKVLNACRVMYIGSELLPTLKAMKDLHNQPAFIPVQQYAAGAKETLNGEVGSIDNFRIVVVPDMLKWAGAGAAQDPLYYNTGNNKDVFPMLVVGDKSFTTIGFLTDGKTVKFEQYHKKPGEQMADLSDPYGEKGFMSIKWYYGFMKQRPERIGLIKTAAMM